MLKVLQKLTSLLLWRLTLNFNSRRLRIVQGHLNMLKKYAAILY